MRRTRNTRGSTTQSHRPPPPPQFHPTPPAYLCSSIHTISLNSKSSSSVTGDWCHSLRHNIERSSTLKGSSPYEQTPKTPPSQSPPISFLKTPSSATPKLDRIKNTSATPSLAPTICRAHSRVTTPACLSEHRRRYPSREKLQHAITDRLKTSFHDFRSCEVRFPVPGDEKAW